MHGKATSGSALRPEMSHKGAGDPVTRLEVTPGLYIDRGGRPSIVRLYDGKLSLCLLTLRTARPFYCCPELAMSWNFARIHSPRSADGTQAEPLHAAVDGQLRPCC